MPTTRTFGDITTELITSNETGQLFIQYGLPTITLSSNKLQATNFNGFDEVGTVFIDDDLELLIGNR